MKILAIETATVVCSVALIVDGKCIGERSITQPNIHSEKLLPIIDELLKEQNIQPNLINAVAVSIGPGSFTGLRIGLSTAKGIAYAHTIPLIAVGTLEALAWRAWELKLTQINSVVVPMIDARRNEVYTAGYTYTDTTMEIVIPVQSITIQNLAIKLENFEHVVLLGDGAEKFYMYLSKFQPMFKQKYTLPPHDQRMCSSAAVGRLGAIKFQRGEKSDLENIEPLYIKEFQTLVKTQHLQVIQ